jgi:hypothetical protein
MTPTGQMNRKASLDRMRERDKNVEARGALARLDGVPRHQCPYKDHRTSSGKVTFSRAFRNSWFTGWDRMDLNLSNEDRS